MAAVPKLTVELWAMKFMFFIDQEIKILINIRRTTIGKR